jgi:hypothetical protein
MQQLLPITCFWVESRLFLGTDAGTIISYDPSYRIEDQENRGKVVTAVKYRNGLLWASLEHYVLAWKDGQKIQKIQ